MARFSDNQAGAPTGSIKSFAGTVLPAGWLFCDGASVNATNYPALAAVLGKTGTFNLPDLRGEFVRGADDMGTAEGAAGNDETGGRLTGTSQVEAVNKTTLSADALTTAVSISGGSHAHSIGTTTDRAATSSSGGSGIRFFDSAPPSSVDTDTDGSHSHSSPAHGHTIDINSTTADETRPRNVALNYIIKT